MRLGVIRSEVVKLVGNPLAGEGRVRDIHRHIEVATGSLGKLRDVPPRAGPHARPADGRRGTLGADDDGEQVSAQCAQTWIRRAIGHDEADGRAGRFRNSAGPLVVLEEQ
jgi:hypothetical protein